MDLFKIHTIHKERKGRIMKQFITQFIKLLQPQAKRILRVILGLLAYEACKMAYPVFYKQLLDSLTVGLDGDFTIVLQLTAAIFIAEMAVGTIDVWLDRRILKLLYWAEEYLPMRVQEKLLELSLGYHEKQQTGEKITRLERGTDKLLIFISHFIWMMCPLAIQIGWTVIVLLTIDVQTTLVFAAAIPIFVVMTWRLHVKTYPIRQQQEDLYEKSSGRLGESVINIKTVKAYAQEAREAREYGTLRDTIKGLGEFRTIHGTRMNFWRTLVINIARVGIILLASYKVDAGELSIGSVVLLLMLSEKVYISMFNLNQILDRMVEATEPLQRLFDLLDTKSDIVLLEDPAIPEKWFGRIEFRSIGFSYDGETRALDGISFVVEPGETVALCGPSGGGKSTIVKLLFRYYDPQQGQILVDGCELRELDIHALRRQTGYVPQEVEVMSGSVWQNITYGNPNATQDQVLQASRLAHVHDFVQHLPRAYDTLVGERGMKLSGGQRQRLGIARALLVDPTILVFDEATSNLDAEAERGIQRALDEVAGKKTLIVVAHRLSTIMKADKIIVVQDGRIAEVGTHEELLKRNGLYERLVNLQTKKEV